MDWVKCSDRLPEDGQRVWAYTIKGHRVAMIYDSIGVFRLIDNWAAALSTECVTHWHPAIIPDPPEEE